jgi:hypothetical protein
MIRSSSKQQKISIAFVVFVMSFMLVPSFASASWTHLGGDPLMSSIKGSGQTARNDFVKKSRSAKFKLAMKRAGLNSRARKAFASAVSRGKFRQCGLSYGDTFVRMAFGAHGVLVDRNVTFRDPRYRNRDARAFCVTFQVRTTTIDKQGRKKTTIKTYKVLVPWLCVNFSVISITTKTTTSTPPSKTTPTVPQGSCPAGTMPVVLVNSGLACQTNTSTQTAEQDTKVDQECKGPNYNSSQCQSTVINIINQTTIQINANCSKVTIAYSDGSTKVEYKDNNGNVVTESYCSSTTVTTPPPAVTFTATITVSATATASATVACPPDSTTATATASASGSGSGTASFTSSVSQADANAQAQAAAQAIADANAKVNATANATAKATANCVPAQGPQISCIWPAHIYKGGSQKQWCETISSVTPSLNITGGTPYAHISGVRTVNYRWDNTPTNSSPCPAGVTCYEGNLWGDSVTPVGVFAHFTAQVTAGSKSASTTGDVPVYEDDFGV